MFGPYNQAVYVGACHFAGRRRDFLRTWAAMDVEKVPSKQEMLAKLDEAIAYAAKEELPLRLSGIITAGGASSGICFGDLADRGLLTKEYIPGCGPDDHTIRWSVVADIYLVDERGAMFVKGDVNDWPK